MKSIGTFTTGREAFLWYILFLFPSLSCSVSFILKIPAFHQTSESPIWVGKCNSQSPTQLGNEGTFLLEKGWKWFWKKFYFCWNVLQTFVTKNLVENRGAFRYSSDCWTMFRSIPNINSMEESFPLGILKCFQRSTSRIRAEQWKLHHTGQTDFEFPSLAFDDFVKDKRKKENRDGRKQFLSQRLRTKLNIRMFLRIVTAKRTCSKVAEEKIFVSDKTRTHLTVM